MKMARVKDSRHVEQAGVLARCVDAVANAVSWRPVRATGFRAASRRAVASPRAGMARLESAAGKVVPNLETMHS